MDGMIFPWIFFLQLILDMSFSNKIDETPLHSQSSTEAAVPSKFMLSVASRYGVVTGVFIMVGLVPGERLILVRSKRIRTCLTRHSALSLLSTIDLWLVALFQSRMFYQLCGLHYNWQ